MSLPAEWALPWPPDWSDPLTQTLAAGACVAALLLWAALSAVLSARRSARRAAALSCQLGALAEATRDLAEGQSRLHGGLDHVAQAQAAAQARMVEAMERRLEDVQRRMGDTLHGAASRTARSLGDLQARLSAIDAAQGRIEKLSGDVLGLQDILSNKQTRGAFGEIQLAELVGQALPPDAYALQHTLSNGRRVDCLIRLPAPPGPLCVDAKFPLEAYEALRAASDDRARADAARALGAAARRHVADIAERYLIPGETAEGALLFLPSEAVYAELHAHHGAVVREGFARKVWIVSPSTLMATLTTLRAVMRDARLRENVGALRREMGLLQDDLRRLGSRVGALDRHFHQAREDVAQITLSAEKAANRAARLEAAEFEGASDASGEAPPLRASG